MEKATNSESNLQLIKEQLIRGWRISVQSVNQSCNTSELRHYLSILRKQGVNIGSEWVNKYGFRFKEYWLIPKEQAA